MKRLAADSPIAADDAGRAHLIDRKGVERYLNKFSATCAVMREYQMQLSGPGRPITLSTGSPAALIPLAATGVVVPIPATALRWW